MALMESPKLIIEDRLRVLAVTLDNAPHGNKNNVKQEFCEQIGWSLPKLHRELKRIGWSSGRKRRSDAGVTRQDEEALLDLAATLKLGVRKNGKATMEIPNARALLAANGREFNVSNGRLSTLLRQRQLDANTQKQATPHLRMRSLHPNHVHMVDPSLCLLFYTPDGKQHMIRDDEAYKNKPAFLERVGELKCWRYVLVDHYSNTTIVRYYQAKGETQANLYDFLLYCWSRQPGRPFHGACKLLVWDKGSANTSKAIKIALHAFPVETYEHKAGNPRAKGGVEEANNRVEKLFESRLKHEPVNCIDELNRAAEVWCNAYNADRIPHYDARLKRLGMIQPQARFSIWQRIRPEQLRILPDLDVCKYLLTAEPQPRKVRGDMSITFVHPVAKRSLQYDLRDIDGVYPRQSVMVSPLVFGDEPQVIVAVEDYKGDIAEHVIAPIDYDEYGMRVDSPVWGEEFDRMPDTSVEQAGKAADQAAFPGKTIEEIDKAKRNNDKPFNGLDAHSHLGELYIPDYLERRGTELDIPNRAQVDIKPLSHIHACRALVGRLGRSLSADENAWIRKQFPDGVPETELAILAGQLQHSDMPQRPELSVIK